MKSVSCYFLVCGIVMTATLLSSCSILGLRKEVSALESHGGVAIRVSPLPTGTAPTYALAWRMENGQRKDSAGIQNVRPDGIAAFSLLIGETYRIGAFTDENGNGAFDVGEPFGVVTDVQPVSLMDPASKVKTLHVVLTRDSELAPGTVIKVPAENRMLGATLNLAVGDVASLDEKRFSPKASGGGLWRPLDFLTSNTIGIYFSEAYDPDRIPLILVYGIGGSPQDWRYLIENFDRSTHQLWFYHYPSGIRLDRVSGALAGGLRLLRDRHGFATCDIVAHSMGGLVAHTALTRVVAEEGVNFVPRLITISTPWGGHKAAESGIRHLKKPVPSWWDVAPDSAFLTAIYTTPLPVGTQHHLVYGSVEKGPFWIKEPNDGVVTIASQTDLRVQRSTSSVTHLLYGHVAILNQPETLELIGSQLGEWK